MEFNINGWLGQSHAQLYKFCAHFLASQSILQNSTQAHAECRTKTIIWSLLQYFWNLDFSQIFFENTPLANQLGKDQKLPEV